MRRFAYPHTTATCLTYLIALLVLGLPATSFAQSGPQYVVESIDVRVLNSNSVVVGKLVTVMSKSDRAVAVLEVDEVLKGPSERIRQIPLRAFGDSKRIFQIYKENKNARLLFYDSTFELLDDSHPEYKLLGDSSIRGTNEIVPYLRDLIRNHPDWNKNETFPVNRVKVPIDARLERWATETLQTRDDTNRLDAVRALGSFKSDANIELMKGIIQGPISSVRDELIQKLASDNLKRWGIPTEDSRPSLK